MKKKEIKRLSIKDIGDIASFEGSSGNRDSFNIFSKSAFFDYDTAKEIYKYCLIVGKNSSKYIAKNPPKNTPTTLDGNYGLKKKKNIYNRRLVHGGDREFNFDKENQYSEYRRRHSICTVF